MLKRKNTYMSKMQVGALELENEVLTSIPDNILASGDISIGLDGNELHLLAKGNIVGSIDCSEFTRDGMLSAVELCSN